MWEALAGVIAKIAIDFLNNYLARKDLQDSVRKEIEIDVLKLALVASEWKAHAATTPNGGSTLSVQPGGGKIILPGESADPHP